VLLRLVIQSQLLWATATFRGKVIDASEKAGERFWPMPLPSDYRALIDTPCSNCRERWSESSGNNHGRPFSTRICHVDHWCHLDIAGPAFLDKTDGENTAGGTGFELELWSNSQSYV
jgi:leucyl aminopeptidase